MSANKNCAHWPIPDPHRVIADANVRDDTYRIAELAILDEGESMRPSLEKLAKSSDVIVRGRATELLRRIQASSPSRAG